MEYIEKILASSYNVEERLSHAFYQLCSQDLQALNIKKLFLKLDYKNKWTSQVLSYGLLGALQKNKEPYLSIITTFMEKNAINVDVRSLTYFVLMNDERENMSEERENMSEERENMSEERLKNIIFTYLEKGAINIKEDLRSLQTIFNYLTHSNYNTLAHQFNEKYEIVKNSLSEDMGSYISFSSGAHSSWGELNNDGSLSFSGAFGGEESEDQIQLGRYSYHPILFNLKHENIELLDKLLSEESPIHPSLVEHSLVTHVYKGNSEAVAYLFAHPKTSEIIKNSQRIKTFLELDDDLSENKKEARAALMVIDFKDKLLAKCSSSNPKI